MLLIILGMGVFPFIPPGFSSCIVNEDWPEAPCLDTIANGWYNQEQVNKWSEYYSYKGSAFMEQKYLSLSDAIQKDLLDEWVGMSTENRNVYEYYFFSGRAPNTGEYYGQFNIIEVNEENAPENGKTSFPNMIPSRDYDYDLINLILVMSGIAGIIVLIVIILWRKRK
jgi:hypothetical protein